MPLVMILAAVIADCVQFVAHARNEHYTSAIALLASQRYLDLAALAVNFVSSLLERSYHLGKSFVPRRERNTVLHAKD